jgi:hypothetical protein
MLIITVNKSRGLDGFIISKARDMLLIRKGALGYQETYAMACYKYTRQLALRNVE